MFKIKVNFRINRIFRFKKSDLLALSIIVNINRTSYFYSKI